MYTQLAALNIHVRVFCMAMMPIDLHTDYDTCTIGELACFCFGTLGCTFTRLSHIYTSVFDWSHLGHHPLP